MKNMFNTEKFLQALENFAPLEISYSAIKKGDYDNSGLIVKCSNTVKKALFSLDLSDLAIEKAIEIGADTIVTHHPAIYNPVKKLAIDGENKNVLNAIKNNLNVISMHLNLDMADAGIDHYLAEGLGATDTVILDDLDEKHGYGREFLCKISAEEVLEKAQKTFGSNKILLYGKGQVNKIASFCGSGGDHALACVIEGKTDADLIVSSDIPHHVLSALIESGKKVMIIPHYVSEQYGFYKFYLWVENFVKGQAQVEYFVDKRFM